MIESIRIGIDPGTEKSGIAIMEGGQYKKLAMWTFMELHDYIDYSEWTVIVSIENVMALKPTWQRNVSKKQMLKISQNVGMVKGTFYQIIKMLEYYNCTYEAVRPLQGLAKQTKHNPELFKKLTGWAGSSNEHTRDAAMLLYDYQKTTGHNND